MIGKADKEKQEFMTGYRPVVRVGEEKRQFVLKAWQAVY
jgi:hypothetical protein